MDMLRIYSSRVLWTQRPPCSTRADARSDAARPPTFYLYIDHLPLFCYAGAHIMLMMRLQRVGRKNDPSYRIVVTDKRTGPKSNKHVELIGSYSPKQNHFQINAERAKYWLSNGVQTSGTVHNLLVSNNIIEGTKVNVLSKKTPIAKEVSEEETSTEEAPAGEGENTEMEETPAEETPAEAAEAKEKAPAT